MKQGTILEAKNDFSFKSDSNRTIKVRKGDRFMVTSPEYRNAEAALIDRAKTARLNIGHLFSRALIDECFNIVG